MAKGAWMDYQKAVLDADGLSAHEKLILICLNSFAGDNNRQVYPSVKTLCRAASIGSYSTLCKYTDQLQAKGWLKKHKRQRASIAYELTEPGTTEQLPIAENTPVDNSARITGGGKREASSNYTSRASNYSSCNGTTKITTKNKEKVEKESLQETDGPDLTNIDPTAWQEFDEYRKSTHHLRKGWSPIARKKAANRLRALSPEQQRACVEYSINGGYTGLFPDRFTNSNRRNENALPGNSHHPGASAPRRQTAAERNEAVDDWLDEELKRRRQ